MTNAEKDIIKQAREIILRELDGDGAEVRMLGLGTFTRKTRSARTMRSPQDGRKIQVPAKSIIAFKASKKTQRDA